jgi:hypothetical protein
MDLGTPGKILAQAAFRQQIREPRGQLPLCRKRILPQCARRSQVGLAQDRALRIGGIGIIEHKERPLTRQAERRSA